MSKAFGKLQLSQLATAWLCVYSLPSLLQARWRMQRLLKISDIWGGQRTHSKSHSHSQFPIPIPVPETVPLPLPFPFPAGQLYFIQTAAVGIWHASSSTTTTTTTTPTSNELWQIQGRAAHFMPQKRRRRLSKPIQSNAMHLPRRVVALFLNVQHISLRS